jgi:hypothetical protein
MGRYHGVLSQQEQEHDVIANIPEIVTDSWIHQFLKTKELSGRQRGRL